MLLLDRTCGGGGDDRLGGGVADGVVFFDWGNRVRSHGEGGEPARRPARQGTGDTNAAAAAARARAARRPSYVSGGALARHRSGGSRLGIAGAFSAPGLGRHRSARPPERVGPSAGGGGDSNRKVGR